MHKHLYPLLPVLLIDDEQYILDGWESSLESRGISNTILCTDSRKVMDIIREHEIEVILLDLTMPYISGEELLMEIRKDFPYIPVIVITGMNDAETAVNCMKHGIFDYMVKAVEENHLISTVERAIENKELQRENSKLKDRFFSKNLEHTEAFSQIITDSEKMHSLFLYVEAIAKSSSTVLITGETGVGKELVARAVHECSGREGKYVTVNIAGFDDSMFSDSLFGHSAGAFTDAKGRRKGLIEQAAGGTLFLDEIGDLSISSQVKLLRLLESHEYYSLGMDVVKRSTARIVMATNRNIHEMVEEEQFRNDLYYRLITHEVTIPPLRERYGDIPRLVDHFLEAAASELGKSKPTPPPELYTLLSTHRFPGNIRELRSMIFNAVSRHETGILSLTHFKKARKTKYHIKSEFSATKEIIVAETFPTLKETTTLLIQEALKRSKGNQSIAANLLGISHQALNKRLSRSKK